MPLVTRQVNQGVFFRTDIEPPDWLNGDIWIDTDNSNLAVNRAGTAVQTGVGTLAQGDLLHASTTDTMTALAKGTASQVLTMNSGATLPEWAEPAGGSWSVLDTDILTVAANNITLTPGTAVNFDDFSEIVAMIDFEFSGSSGLGVQVNTLTTGIYNTLGSFFQTAASETVFQNADDTQYTLTDDTTAIGTGRSCSAIVYMQLGDNDGNKPAQFNGVCKDSRDAFFWQSYSGTGTTSLSTLTEFKFITTGSSINFETTSRAILYGVSRT